jgi:DNA polymerase-4/DNA polymerase V
MNIVRRHVARVEEYSVDECFADLTTGHYGEKDYVELGRRIKEDIRRLLGVTYSAGIANTKVLAKIASKRNKPDGFTVIEPETAHKWISNIPIGVVWGIGMSTVIAMRSHGIDTAGKLAALPQERVEELFHRPQIEIWHELNGRQLSPVTIPVEIEHSKWVQDTRSFLPATSDRKFLLAELSKHTESACFHLRQEKLLARCFSFFLKTKQGEYARIECTLHRPTSSPSEILPYVRRLFDRIYRPSLLYKSTGIALFKLRPATYIEHDLFGESHKSGIREEIFSSMDSLNRRYGEGSVKLASSLGGRKHSVRPSVIGLPLQYLGGVE